MNAEIFTNAQPERFIENLKYMGIGMLGIFIVIGVIVVLTMLLNSATTKKNNKQQ